MTQSVLSLDLIARLDADAQQFILTQLKTSILPDDMGDICLSAFFDARGLKCPLPLLKAKISLRDMHPDEQLYLITSDANSQTDLLAFCHKNQLPVHCWQSDTLGDDTARLFHFIITKKG